jgi:rfaE bifunctional protein nucleotidyltransferase chain/domain
MVSKKEFKSVTDLAKYLAPLRKKGKKLVTTNGCFDIIHAGHIKYLREAKRLGDILAVGVNADRSVRKLKGAGRPLQNENDRRLVISALDMVDAAFVFCEDDPRTFLEILKPDIHVKGGDYTSDIIEKPVVEQNGGRIKIVSYLKGRSTTRLIRNMGRKTC